MMLGFNTLKEGCQYEIILSYIENMFILLLYAYIEFDYEGWVKGE